MLQIKCDDQGQTKVKIGDRDIVSIASIDISHSVEKLTPTVTLKMTRASFEYSFSPEDTFVEFPSLGIEGSSMKVRLADLWELSKKSNILF